MAVIANVRGLNVCRALTGRIRAVMARAATPQYLGMIDSRYWHEQCSVVAVLTDIGRLHVRRALAGRLRAVVARHAVADDVVVIE